MNQTTMATQDIKYALYARKSSEDKYQQVISIPSQIAELNGAAIRNNLDIKKTLSEEKSAKRPYKRPVFDELIKSIEKGEINGLIVWHPDRISRNSVDAGKIIYLMDLGKLVQVWTPSQIFRNTPGDKFYLNLLCSSAKLDNDNKGVNVARGLKTKAEMGWFASRLPIGYMCDPINKKGLREVLVDPDRFPLVRKMFDRMLTGSYTPPKILKEATEDWGLRTIKGHKLSRSRIYHLFTNTLYYGEFEFPKGSGNWYQGKHKPMISMDEFDRIQILLGKKGLTRPKNQSFAFTGIMRCGDCGASVTAEIKNQIICTSCKTKFSHKNTTSCPKCHTPIEKMVGPTILKYTYYHCTKRKNKNCTQGSITESQLETQIMGILENIEIPEEFHNWVMKYLRMENAKEDAAINSTIAHIRKQNTECANKLDRLIDMRACNELSEDEFVKKKSLYLHEKQRLQTLLDDFNSGVHEWIDAADQAFLFAQNAKSQFVRGSMDDKKQILQAAGSNPTFKEKSLTVEIEEPFISIGKISKEVKSISERLELKKPINKSVGFENQYAESSEICPIEDSNLRPLPCQGSALTNWANRAFYDGTWYIVLSTRKNKSHNKTNLAHGT